MRIIVLFIIMCCGLQAIGQITIENEKSNPLGGNIDNNLLPLPNNSPQMDLLTPQRVAPKLLLDEDKPKDIGFGKKSPFDNPAKELQEKLNERPGIDLSRFRRNQYLGDVTTNTKKVKILCRDYQYVDGDRIKISVNDKIIAPNIYLKGSFTAISFKLQPGFNKIDFEALNMGEAAPNTAELLIYDDKSKLIAQHQWAITTGFKASFIVVKND